MDSSKKTALYVAVGVLFGFAFGVTVGDRFLRPPPPPPGFGSGESISSSSEKGFQSLLNRYGAQLKLSDAQREQVKTILSEKQKQMLQLKTETLPRLWALQSETTEDVRKLLTEDQKVTFDRMNERDGSGGAPPPPPHMRGEEREGREGRSGNEMRRPPFDGERRGGERGRGRGRQEMGGEMEPPMFNR